MEIVAISKPGASVEVAIARLITRPAMCPPCGCNIALRIRAAHPARRQKYWREWTGRSSTRCIVAELGDVT